MFPLMDHAEKQTTRIRLLRCLPATSRHISVAGCEAAAEHTLRPRAKRRRILMQRSWHDFSKFAILLSLVLRDTRSVCWALPFLNSPKFIALPGTLVVVMYQIPDKEG